MPGVTLEIFERRGRKGEIVKLSGTQFILGRGEDCDLSVESDVASREHAQIQYRQGHWMLMDLDSSNGTFLNKRLIESAEVQEQDVITVGKTGWKVRIIKLYPATAGSAAPDDATRIVSDNALSLAQTGPPAKRSAPPKKPAKPPKKPASKPKKTPSKPSAPPPPAGKKKGLPLCRTGLLVGAAFGLVTYFELWPKAMRFPNSEIAAPLVWIFRGLTEVAAGFITKNLQLVMVVLLVLWYGLFGLFVFRIFRFWVPALIMSAGHLLALGLLGGGFGFAGRAPVVLIFLGVVAGLSLLTGVITRMGK